ncbi:hypothetical protein F8M41_012602 [Gigaspora margarita]|uniref:Uncharacterized protein n=1 Tax=Gigaspora margarita TaxID=4874 RepID=A0A8H3WXS3_GIGMA|nr:hypothetical protein F8M41_012602 [Gigaspora margarita]
MLCGRKRQVPLLYKVGDKVVAEKFATADTDNLISLIFLRKEKEHSHKQVHIHQPIFTGGGTFYGGVISIDGTIGTINDTVNDPVVSKGGKRLL